MSFVNNMLGFSLPKILLLFFIVVFIFYIFSLFEKISYKKSKKKHSDNDTKELQLCKTCGSYCELDSHICERSS